MRYERCDVDQEIALARLEGRTASDATIRREVRRFHQGRGLTGRTENVSRVRFGGSVEHAAAPTHASDGWERVETILSALPERQRQIAQLRLAGASHADIAAALHVSTVTLARELLSIGEQIGK